METETTAKSQTSFLKLVNIKMLQTLLDCDLWYLSDVFHAFFGLYKTWYGHYNLLQLLKDSNNVSLERSGDAKNLFLQVYTTPHPPSSKQL